jgi:hypothetical protein
MVDIRYFDFRDVFRAPRAGISAKKLWVATFGLLLAHLGYVLFTYLAMIASGMTLAGIWSTHGIWPVPACAHYGWYAWLLQLIGLGFSGMVLMLTATAVSNLAFQQLRGDDFYSSGDAWAFARSRWWAMVLAPLAISGIIAFLSGAGWILGLIGRIPWLGPVTLALHLPLVIFFGMVVFFSGLVFLTHFAIGPAIISTTSGDAMDVLVQLFSCAWSQPWRFLTYQFQLKVITVAAVHIVVVFVTAGLWVGRWIIAPVMGPGYQQVLHIGHELALFRCPVTAGLGLATNGFTTSLCPWLPGLQQRCLDSLFAADLTGAGAGVHFAGHLTGLILFLVMFTIAGYFLATWFSGQTIIYLILRKKKDGEDMLEYDEDDDWNPMGEEDNDATLDEPAEPNTP